MLPLPLDYLVAIILLGNTNHLLFSLRSKLWAILMEPHHLNPPPLFEMASPVTLNTPSDSPLINWSLISSFIHDITEAGSLYHLPHMILLDLCESQLNLSMWTHHLLMLCRKNSTSTLHKGRKTNHRLLVVQLFSFKSLADELVVIDWTLLDNDFTLHIHNGLGS